MKKELLSFLRFPIFFSLGIALLDCIVMDAFSWVTFNGFGGITMEYTKIGLVAANIIPSLLPIAVLFIRLVKCCRYKLDKKRYLVESAGHILGFGAGIIIFLLVYVFEMPLLAELLRWVTWRLAALIRIVGLVKYPVP